MAATLAGMNKRMDNIRRRYVSTFPFFLATLPIALDTMVRRKTRALKPVHCSHISPFSFSVPTSSRPCSCTLTIWRRSARARARVSGRLCGEGSLRPGAGAVRPIPAPAVSAHGYVVIGETPAECRTRIFTRSRQAAGKVRSAGAMQVWYSVILACNKRGAAGRQRLHLVIPRNLVMPAQQARYSPLEKRRFVQQLCQAA